MGRHLDGRSWEGIDLLSSVKEDEMSLTLGGLAGIALGVFSTEVLALGGIRGSRFVSETRSGTAFLLRK